MAPGREWPSARSSGRTPGRAGRDGSPEIARADLRLEDVWRDGKHRCPAAFLSNPKGDLTFNG